MKSTIKVPLPIKTRLIKYVRHGLLVAGLLFACSSGRLALAQGDSYEPDNAPDLASNIFANTPQSHMFTNHYDVDWVTFTTTVDHAYQIGMTNLDADGVYSLSLYDSATNQIGETVYNTGFGDDILLTPFLGTALVYYAQAQADADPFGGPSGPYWMVVTDLGAGDQHEPDNTLATASNLVVDVAHTNHTLHWDGDVDFVRFTNMAQRLYSITFTNTVITAVLNTYDQNGQVLATDSPSSSGDGVLYLFPGIDGTNYVSVTFAPTFSVEGSPYDLLVSNLGVPAGADPYEFDNTLGTASNIVVGTSQTDRSIHHAEDLDYIAFTAEANHYYRLDVTNVAGTLNVILSLSDNTNGVLDSVDDGGSGVDETIAHFFVSGGTNYARVRNSSGTMEDTGTYHVVVNDLGPYPPDPYESDDTPATASNIVAGIAQTSRTVHWGTDLDYIKFAYQAYHSYRVDVTDVGAALNATLTLFAADGTNTLAASNTGGPGGNETISYLPLSAGTNYILVRNSTDGMADTGAYHVAVADLGAVPTDPYEPDDSLGTASNIVVDVAQTNRTLHLVTDVDYVKVALQSNRYYRFETYDQQPVFINQLVLLGTNGSDVLAQQTNNLEYRITSSGDYYLRVSAYATNAAGSYTLRVKDLRTRYRLPNGGSMCSPAIGYDGRIYVAVDTNLYAMQPDGSSTQIWNTSSTVRSSPALGANGLIYIAANDAFHIFSTNEATNWTANLNPPVVWPMYPPSPALGPTGAVYVGAITNWFYSLNSLAQTNWYSPTTGYTYSAPAVDADGNVYFSCTDRWLRKLTSAGASNWGVNLGQPLYASPALDTNGDVVVAGATGTVFLVSGTNGAILRTWQAGTNFYRGNSPVIGPSGTVYIVSGNSGRLYALQPDGNTGSVWNLGAQTYGSTPAIGSDGTIYVGAGSNFYALNPNGTTSYVWNLPGLSDIYSSPAIDSQGLIYLNCLDTVYAFYGTTWPTGGLAQTAWPMLSRNARHTGAIEPSAPTTVTAGDGVSSSGVAVAWTSVTNAYLGYEVWRGATNQSVTAVFLYATVATNFTDTNAAPGQPYSYWVKSRNYVGAGGFGGSDVGWRMITAPIGVTASDGIYTTMVQVAWNSVSGAVNYVVWRNTTSDTDSASNLAEIADTNYSDTAAVTNTTYYYWVQARGANGTNSAFSLPDTGWRAAPLIGGTPPSVPTGVTASDGIYTTKVEVTWNSVSGAVNYVVWRNTTSDTGSASNLAEIADTNYSDTAAVINTTYYYWVQARGANGTNSAFSLPDTGWRAAPLIGDTPPSVPTGVTASDGIYTTMVQVAWNSVSGAVNYVVWRNTTSDTDSASNLAEIADTNYSDTAAVTNTTYYYWVQARGANGTNSAFSLPDTGWRAAPESGGTLPSVPTSVTASDGAFTDHITIDWNTSINATAYQVWRGISASSSAATLLASTSTNSYSDTNVVSGSLYYFWIKAANAYGASAFSSADSGYAGLASPTSVTASDGLYGDKVRVTWSAVSGATGYDVWRHTANDSSAATRIATNVTTATYDDRSATAGQTLYYWIKTMSAAGVGPFSASDSGWRRSVGYTHYADVDLDGDRKMDLVLFDPVTGAWYAKLSASGYAIATVLLGGPGCTPVPGDYDGDIKTDPGIYEELTGLWSVMLSSMGYGIATSVLGGMGYAPTPGDFDGDRKTDLAVYQSATHSASSGQAGDWTVKLSASGYAEASISFGSADYLPVQRDYDGDAKADPAIYHLTNGNWHVMLSSSGYGIASAPGFGGTGYTPVPGDYDGDRLADPAIYSESAGTWYVMLSASGYLIASATRFGGTGYAALPGDYDGDGKTDPAVYYTGDPSTGSGQAGDWYVMLSGSDYGIAAVNFGGAGYDSVGIYLEAVTPICYLSPSHEGDFFISSIASPGHALSFPVGRPLLCVPRRYPPERRGLGAGRG